MSLKHSMRRTAWVLAAAVLPAIYQSNAEAGTTWAGNAASDIFGTHDGNVSSGGSGTKIEITTSKPVSLFSFPALGDGVQFRSNAALGVAHLEPSGGAQAAFGKGTGVSQFDPEPDTAASSLIVDFQMIWNVDSDGLFSINPYFNIPIAASVGPGGEATFAALIRWEADISNFDSGFNRSKIRNDWNLTTQRFTNSSTTDTVSFLRSFTAPSSSIFLSSLGSGSRFILSGKLTFTADNHGGPTGIELFADADGGITAGGVLPPEPAAVPLPAAAWTGLSLLALLGVARWIHRPKAA